MIEGGISKSRRIARGGPTRRDIIANPAGTGLSGDQCPVCANTRYRGAYRTHPRCADMATELARGSSIDEILARHRLSPREVVRIRAFADQGLSPAHIVQLLESR